MTTSNDMRKLLNLMESRINDGSVQYTDAAGEVTASLVSHDSAIFTKLAQKMQKVEAMEAEVKQLKAEIKSGVKSDIMALFDASDAVSTRVIDTRSFILTLSKDPKATESPKYKDILEVLSKQLTPELLAVLEQLKKEMITTTQKDPSLRIKSKDLSLDEGVMDKVRGAYDAFKTHVLRWGQKYDQKLDKLKMMAGL